MRVAIIGAGFSGMLAAYQLEKKGIDVTVYEKEELIGGHCRTLVNGESTLELGTVFSFSTHIKSLLTELGVDYYEQFTYRSFVNDAFEKVEHISREKVATLIEELSRLEKILARYMPSLGAVNYGYIHEDLLLSLFDFLKFYDLNVISQVITPHLSSYGFGDIHETQAYYAFNIFGLETITSFIRGDKLLFVTKGISEIIRKLSQNISDIRYAIEVVNIEMIDHQVKVETPYGYDWYDKVLITTMLPRDVIKHDLYNQMMQKIDTNPYVTCAYEVENKNIVTTYYKGHLGKKGKIQFFHTYKQNDKSILVAYAYGNISKDLINGITSDLEKIGITVNHLITAKQWFIFPHLKSHNLSSNFYIEIAERQKKSHICLIGSLVSKPSFSNLYTSVTQFIEDNF